MVRTIFYQADHASAMAQLRDVCEMLRPKFSEAADLLEASAEDVLTHLHYPGSTVGGFTPPTCWSVCTRR